MQHKERTKLENERNEKLGGCIDTVHFLIITLILLILISFQVTASFCNDGF